MAAYGVVFFRQSRFFPTISCYPGVYVMCKEKERDGGEGESDTHTCTRHTEHNTDSRITGITYTPRGLFCRCGVVLLEKILKYMCIYGDDEVNASIWFYL